MVDRGPLPKCTDQLGLSHINEWRALLQVAGQRICVRAVRSTTMTTEGHASIDVYSITRKTGEQSRMQSQQSEVESNVESQVESTEDIILCNYQALKVNVCIST